MLIIQKNEKIMIIITIIFYKLKTVQDQVRLTFHLKPPVGFQISQPTKNSNVHLAEVKEKKSRLT